MGVTAVQIYGFPLVNTSWLLKQNSTKWVPVGEFENLLSNMTFYNTFLVWFRNGQVVCSMPIVAGFGIIEYFTEIDFKWMFAKMQTLINVTLLLI